MYEANGASQLGEIKNKCLRTIFGERGLNRMRVEEVRKIFEKI